MPARPFRPATAQVTVKPAAPATPAARVRPRRRTRIGLAAVLGGTSLAGALLLLFGAASRAGRLGTNPLWDGWQAADPAVRFAVVSTSLLALLGAGSAAFVVTWRRHRRLDLLAASAFLVAGVALLVGATYQPAYGASQSTAFAVMACLAAGLAAILFSGYKRLQSKQAPTMEKTG